MQFDAAKDAANIAKHGISLAAFDRMTDPVFATDAQHSVTEVRFLVYGRIDGTVYVAAVTYRDADVRVINLRRASRAERRLYEA